VPVVFRLQGFKFFFYIRVLLEAVQANQKLLEDAWHDYFA